MANNKTLTTANSAFTMAARGVFPVPFSFQGYGTDASFAIDNITTGEARMGVDGHLSVGYVPVAKTITFTLEPTSPTIEYLDAVIAVEDAQREKVIFDGTGYLQGTKQKYAMTNGYLMEHTPINAGAKTLQPRTFQFVFEKITPSPI